MLKGFFVSLMTLFLTLVFVSSSQALVIQNKSDTTFNVASADYAELSCGTSICPDKQKHCLALSGCETGSITLSTPGGTCIQPIRVCANEKIVIKGKKGNYRVIRYALNGEKEKINFKCCCAGCGCGN